MKAEYPFNLYMMAPPRREPIDVTQNDNLMVELVAKLKNRNGTAFLPPEGAVANFIAVKPDGHGIVLRSDDPEEPKVTLAADEVRVSLPREALAVTGWIACKIAIQDNDAIASSQEFSLMCNRDLLPEDFTESEAYQSIIYYLQHLGEREAEFDDMKEQFYQAINGLTEDDEVINARIDGPYSTTYDTLKLRLDHMSGLLKGVVDGDFESRVSALEEEVETARGDFESHLNDYATYKDSNNLKVVEIEEQVGEIKDGLDDAQKYLAYVDIYDSDLISDVYGVEADFVNNKFTRLAGAVGKTPGADFDSINAFGGRKRCILTDDGVVLAYYGEPGYTETGKLTQEITLGEEENAVTYQVGTPVQVMVEQPKFYYKVVPLQLEPITDGIGYHLRKARYYVSDTPKVGFKVHPAFVRNGVEVDKIYLSAYEGSIYDESAGTYLLADEQIADFNADKLSSIAYAKPASGLTQNLTRANTRKLAENRGAGWQQKDVLCASASQMLMMIEYAAFNMQSAIGLGVVNKPLGEGNESELTGATTNLGNASGMAVGTNGLVSISYRGEENFWGNVWKWIDGLNIYIDPDTRKTDAYWAAEDFSDDTGSAPYKHVGFNLAPNADGFVSAFGWSEECDFLFLPTETLGNSALPVGDRFYNTQTGWRVARLGGFWNNGLDAGAFYWNVYYSAANRYRYIGGGAVYVPQAS